MDDAIQNNKYLTYSFAIRINYKWQQHYFMYEKEFRRHGYDNGVESSFHIMWDQVNWLFQNQFQVNLKLSRVVIQKGRCFLDRKSAESER